MLEGNLLRARPFILRFAHESDFFSTRAVAFGLYEFVSITNFMRTFYNGHSVLDSFTKPFVVYSIKIKLCWLDSDILHELFESGSNSVINIFMRTKDFSNPRWSCL